MRYFDTDLIAGLWSLAGRHGRLSGSFLALFSSLNLKLELVLLLLDLDLKSFLRAEFGQCVFHDNGELNRAALRTIIFEVRHNHIPRLQSCLEISIS